MVFFSEGMLRHAISEYMAHYHEERNNQGVDGKLIRPVPLGNPVSFSEANGLEAC